MAFALPSLVALVSHCFPSSKCHLSSSSAFAPRLEILPAPPGVDILPMWCCLNTYYSTCVYLIVRAMTMLPSTFLLVSKDELWECCFSGNRFFRANIHTMDSHRRRQPSPGRHLSRVLAGNRCDVDVQANPPLTFLPGTLNASITVLQFQRLAWNVRPPLGPFELLRGEGPEHYFPLEMYTIS